MTDYIGVIEREKGTLYSVFFPDLPGCTTAGNTMDEAIDRAEEALRLWAEDALDKGEKLPRRSDPEEIWAQLARDGIEGAMIMAVPLLLNAARPVRVNVTIPADTLEAIDKAAKRYGMNRSAFLADAAIEKIRRVG